MISKFFCPVVLCLIHDPAEFPFIQQVMIQVLCIVAVEFILKVSIHVILPYNKAESFILYHTHISQFIQHAAERFHNLTSRMERPEYFAERSEKSAKTKDSRPAREFMAALPIELSEAQWEKLLSDFISDTFVADGCTSRHP